MLSVLTRQLLCCAISGRVAGAVVQTQPLHVTIAGIPYMVLYKHSMHFESHYKMHDTCNIGTIIILNSIN